MQRCYTLGLIALVRVIAVFISLALLPHYAMADDVPSVAFAGAGSLRAALVEIARMYTASNGERVDLTFGPSGNLERQIETGELRPDIFASADLVNPRKLVAIGEAANVVHFTRNAVCAVAKAGWSVPSAGRRVQMSTLHAALLDPATQIGTSTPGSDPAGDYARQILAQAGLSPASSEPQKSHGLPANALMIYGGYSGSPAVPNATDPVTFFLLTPPAGWAVDVILTYCSAARSAAAANSALEVLELPANLATTADYGYTLPSNARNHAGGIRFGAFLLAPQAQAIFAAHGFLPPTLDP